MSVRKKILIVDDEPDIVEFVEYNLRREQFETVKAFDGPTALKLAGKHQPDLILLDLMIPGIDGLEVCRQLKAQSATSRIPVIMLTTQGEERERQCGLEAGVAVFLQKPISQDELHQEIDRVWPKEYRSPEPSMV